MAKLFLLIAVVTVALNSVQSQSATDTNTSGSPNNNGLGGLLGGLMGGNSQQQQQQPPQLPQFGSLLNNLMNNQSQGLQQQGPGGLGELLRSIPRRGMEMIQGFVNGVRNILPGGRQNLNGPQQQNGRNPLNMMNDMPNPLSSLQNGQLQQQTSGLFGQGNPLESLTSNLNLNGLTDRLGDSLPQNNLPNQLNGLSEGLQRGVGDVSQQLSRTLSNVIPNIPSLNSNGASSANSGAAATASSTN